MDLFEEAHGWGSKRLHSLKSVSHISYNDETWHSYALPKDPKIKNKKNHETHPLSSADIGIFSPEISNFCYIKKYRYRLHFNI